MAIHSISSDAGPATGLLLVGHGTREAVGVDEFLATARLVAASAPELAVEPCFLEFAEPTIAAAFRHLAQRRVSRIMVAPVLLFSAGHAERDIPAAVAAAAAEYPEVAVEQRPHLGCHESLVALAQLRFDEAVASRPVVHSEETMLVLVGRGSHSPAATTEMLRFADLLRERTPLAKVRTAFVAMAEPPLARVLDEVADCGAPRIVVQPHLLFGGVLVDRIGQMVERRAAEDARCEWLVARHLGPSKLLAEAILDRAFEGAKAAQR